MNLKKIYFFLKIYFSNLFLFFLFFLILKFSLFQQSIQKNFTLDLFLEKNIDELQIEKIKNDIIFFSKINKVNILDIYFKPKKVSLKDFIKETGVDFFEILDENPILDSFSISSDFANEKNLDDFIENISKIKGIYELNFKKNFFKNINNKIYAFKIVIYIFFLVFFIFTIRLIINFIKFFINPNKNIIKAMNIMGIKSFDIKKNFILDLLIYFSVLSSFISNTIIFLLFFFKNFISIDFELLVIIIVSIHLFFYLFTFIYTNIEINKFIKSSFD